MREHTHTSCCFGFSGKIQIYNEKLTFVSHCVLTWIWRHLSACYQQKETGCFCCQRSALPWRPKVSPTGDECRALGTGTMLSGQTIRAQANLALCPGISFVGSREEQVWMKIHMNSCFSGGMTVGDTCRALNKNTCEHGLCPPWS